MTDPTDAPAAEKAPADSWQMAATKELFVHGFLEPDEDHGLEAAAGIIAKHAPPSPGVPAGDVPAESPHFKAIRVALGVSLNSSRPLVCYVADLIAERDALRAALEAAAPVTPEGERARLAVEVADALVEADDAEICYHEVPIRPGRAVRLISAERRMGSALAAYRAAAK